MDVGINPEWQGSSQPRQVRIEGNRLYIINPLFQGDELIWERVEKHDL